jgi:myo-inositol-1-phosphate synthase
MSEADLTQTAIDKSIDGAVTNFDPYTMPSPLKKLKQNIDFSEIYF